MNLQERSQVNAEEAEDEHGRDGIEGGGDADDGWRLVPEELQQGRNEEDGGGARPAEEAGARDEDYVVVRPPGDQDGSDVAEAEDPSQAEAGERADDASQDDEDDVEQEEDLDGSEDDSGNVGEGEDSDGSEDDTNRGEEEDDDDFVHDRADDDGGLPNLFANLNFGQEPRRSFADFNFQEGRVYRSSLARADNGTVIAVGFGYEFANGGASPSHYKASNGNRYDMSRRAPMMCFNCEKRDDVPYDDKFHWRADCPFARGNPTI